MRIEQKVLWAAFLSQVVRSLPPWESEIFTYMRPNELFALTTEMWGTRLAAESPPTDVNGMQRHSFWICGIVERPPKTTFKTHAIQPRNPLLQQGFLQERHMSRYTAPHPTYSPHAQQRAPARLLEQQRSNNPSSARSQQFIAHSSPQAPYTAHTACPPRSAQPVPLDQRQGPLTMNASHTSLASYSVSERSSMGTSSTHTAHIPLSNQHAAALSHPQASSSVKSMSHSISAPTLPLSAGSSFESRAILPPAPSMESAQPSVNSARPERVGFSSSHQPVPNPDQPSQAASNSQDRHVSRDE